jgi:hypothetical protein
MSRHLALVTSKREATLKPRAEGIAWKPRHDLLALMTCATSGESHWRLLQGVSTSKPEKCTVSKTARVVIVSYGLECGGKREGERCSVRRNMLHNVRDELLICEDFANTIPMMDVIC